MKKILVEKVFFETFLVEIFFYYKIISSETVWIKKILVEKNFDVNFFCRKFFVVKSFPRKQFG
jgi:hypothetical protein